jgi:DNA-binding ferritin-like protein
METTSKASGKMPTLISILFAARTQAHIFHLQTKSYSQHMALNSYYDGLIDSADSLAEAYQGREGIIEEYPKVSVVTSDPIKLVEQVRSWVDKNRKSCSQYSEIQNLIDELQDLNNSTLYKLKNLF